MNKFASAILIGSLALGGAALATASDDYRGKGEHHGKYCDKEKRHGSRMEHMASKLDLSDKQLKQVRAIEEKYQPKKQAIRAKMKTLRQQLREAMHADNIDQAAVKKLAQQKGDIKADKMVLHAQKRAEINKVLTKEQRAKMKEMHHKRGHRHHGHGKKYDD